MNPATTHPDLDERLITAAKSGDLSRVQQLIQAGADIHANFDDSLRWAAFNGHLEAVKFLLENGASIHAADDNALRWASKNGHIEVTALLFNQDPDYFTVLIEQDSTLSEDESLRALVNHYQLGLHYQSNTASRSRCTL